jgi:hypothetical protein
MATDFSDFIITQGAQPDDEIFEDKEVYLQIVGLKKSDFNANQMIVQFKILSGKYVGQRVSDFVTYDPNDSMSWKYRKLRNSANVPYSKTEPPTINIAKLLMDKVVKADLTKYTNEEKGKDYQNVVYGKPLEPGETIPTSKEEEKTYDFSETIPAKDDTLTSEEDIYEEVDIAAGESNSDW